MSLGWVKLDAAKTQELIAGNTAEDVRRALCLLLYCAKMENGGVIQGCASWGRGKWMRLVGCYPIKQGYDVDGLWHWQGENLVSEWYDVKSEHRVRELRARGKKGGSMRVARGSHGDVTGASRGDGYRISDSKLKKTSQAHALAKALTDKIREEEKEKNKEKDSKGDEVLLGIESPEMRAELDDMHAIVAGRLTE